MSGEPLVIFNASIFVHYIKCPFNGKANGLVVFNSVY
jgi:hypothetical protein